MKFLHIENKLKSFFIKKFEKFSVNKKIPTHFPVCPGHRKFPTISRFSRCNSHPDVGFKVTVKYILRIFPKFCSKKFVL